MATKEERDTYRQALREGTPLDAPWGNLTDKEREKVQTELEAERAPLTKEVESDKPKRKRADV